MKILRKILRMRLIVRIKIFVNMGHTPLQYTQLLCRIVDLVYVHMYAAYDIRRPICDSEFSKPSHLCFAVHMCPSPICDIRRPICDSDFFGLGPKKLDRK